MGTNTGGPGSLATGRGRLWPLAEAPVADWRVRLLECHGHGSTLSAGRAQCKPADRYDCYCALRQVEKLQAQARGATMAPPLRQLPRRRRPDAPYNALAIGTPMGIVRAADWDRERYFPIPKHPIGLINEPARTGLGGAVEERVGGIRGRAARRAYGLDSGAARHRGGSRGPRGRSRTGRRGARG
jgi:hypothetical protein